MLTNLAIALVVPGIPLALWMLGDLYDRLEKRALARLAEDAEWQELERQLEARRHG